MVSRYPVIDDDGEVGDLSKVDPKLFRPPHEVLPVELEETLGIERRGPQKARTKVATTIRLSPEVVEFFRGLGSGWQSRVDGVLRDYVAKHTPR
mgnify:FL=1